jgi:tetratricopeptide (TPR) repeat protein
MIANPEGRDRGNRLYCEIGGAMLELQAHDLTPAGVFVPTEDPFEVDREVEVTLHSSIGELNARCLVVQVISPERAAAEGRNGGCGMLFVDLEDDQRAWIGLTLAALARSEAAGRSADEARRSQRPELETRRSRPPNALRNSAAPSGAPAQRSLPPPTVRRPPRPSAPERPQTQAQLERELSALQGRSPWAVLGLKEDAGPEAARDAFLAMSKRYHPHAYARFDSAEINQLATDLFIAHKRAYTALCALLRPKNSDAPAAQTNVPMVVSVPPASAIAGAATPSRSPRPPMPPAILSFGNDGSDVLKAPVPRSRKDTSPERYSSRKRAAEAESAFAAALKLLASSRFDEAAAAFERVCELDPDRNDAQIWLHVCRARELMANGHEEQAREAYRVVLGLDPAHHEALSQVRNDDLDERKRTGLMSRWFGSGDD